MKLIKDYDSRIKVSQKSSTERFDVAMTSLSSDTKDEN